MSKLISRLHFTETQPDFLLPQTGRGASLLSNEELTKVLPFLPEKLLRELLVLTKNKARLELIMRNTSDASVRRQLIKQFKLGLTLNGVVLDLETVDVRRKALREQVKRLALFYPKSDVISANLDLATVIFRSIIPFTVTSDLQVESLNRQTESINWMLKQKTGLSPVFGGKYLPPLFFHGGTAIPNMTMLSDKQNLLAYNLDDNLEQLKGEATAWFYAGRWQSWGYARSGYWLNPRPSLCFKGERINVIDFLFGSNYANRKDQKDKLNLNPYHWVKADYGQ